MRMRCTPLCLGLVLAGLLLSSGPGWAGPNPDVVLFLHLVPTDTPRRAKCSGHEVEDFTMVRTAGELDADYLAYVLLAAVDTTQGVTGVQFGISYDDTTAIEILSWTNCALYEWPMDDWPKSDTGNLITWHQHEDCQRDLPVVAGFFYLKASSPVRFRIVPRPVDEIARVAACGINTVNAPEKQDDVKSGNLGWVDFGGGQGYNPWDPEQNLETMQNRFKPIKD
jgi:hypothetical protein